MKRKLPPATSKYDGPDDTVIPLLHRGDWVLWAMFNDGPVLVSRNKTHEVPGSKWVEFHVAPEFQLVPKGLVYADPDFATSTVRCEWSDFLRLTRWRKSIQSLAPVEQARIAKVLRVLGGEQAFRLVAVDDPIRRTKEDA